MSKLVDDVAEALCGPDEHLLWLDSRDAARAAIAVFAGWIDENYPKGVRIFPDEIADDLASHLEAQK